MSTRLLLMKRAVQAVAAAYIAWLLDQLMLRTPLAFVWALLIATITVALNAAWIFSLEGESAAHVLGVDDLALPRSTIAAALQVTLRQVAFFEVAIVLPLLVFLGALGAQRRAVGIRVVLFFGPAIASSAVHGWRALVRRGD